MLSEFEVPKPNLEFNQVYLDNQDVYLESLKVTLYVTNDYCLNGLLHLTTRSFVFEPKVEKSPLIKLRICDGVRMKTAHQKNAIEKYVKEIEEKYYQFTKTLKRSLSLD